MAVKYLPLSSHWEVECYVLSLEHPPECGFCDDFGQRNIEEVMLFQGPGLAGVSNLWPIWPRIAVNVAQHKIVNLLKTLWDFFCNYVSQYI